MKRLKKIKKGSIDTVETIANICACSAYQCSHGCNSSEAVYEGTDDVERFSRVVSSSGMGPW